MERDMEKNAKKKNEPRGGFMDYGFLHPRFLCSPLASFPPLPGGGQANNWYQAVSPPPAMIFPGNGNAFPGGSVPANNSPVTPIRPGFVVINSNPMNTPEMNDEDGGLDLTLRL
nr:zinc finger protein STAMENLESS 1-like [Ipomoea batatas]